MTTAGTDNLEDRDPGSPSLLDKLGREFIPSLVRRLRAFGANTDDAEDAAQSAFEVYLAYPARDEVLSPEAFMTATAKRQVIQSVKAVKRREKIVEANNVATLLHGPAPSSPEDDAVQRDVIRAIYNLPPRQRDVVLLSRFCGYTHREIARHLNITEETVSRNLTRALKDCMAIINNDILPHVPETGGAQQKEKKNGCGACR